MKCSKLFYLSLLWSISIFVFFACQISAQVTDLSLWPPQDLNKLDSQKGNLPSSIDINEIPYIETVENYDKLNGRIRIRNGRNLTRLRLIVDSFVDVKKTMTGDYFKAYTQEDFYIIPKGSWLRGHISYIKKPNIIFMSGKLKVNFDQLITPYGEVTPLISNIDIQEGIADENGLLNPLIKESNQSKGVWPHAPTKVTTENNFDAGSLLDGSLTGLTPQFSSGNLARGQELQIVVGQ